MDPKLDSWRKIVKGGELRELSAISEISKDFPELETLDQGNYSSFKRSENEKEEGFPFLNSERESRFFGMSIKKHGLAPLSDV